MTRSELCLGLAAAILFLGHEADAGLIAYEPFNYAAGTSLEGQSGGTGFARNWAQSGGNAQTASNYQVVSAFTRPGLERGGIATAGNHVTTASQAAVTGVERFLNADLNNGVFYMSALIRPEGVIGQGAFNGFFGMYLDSVGSDANDLFVGKPGSAAVDPWVLETRGGGGTQGRSNYIPVSGRTDLLVLKMDLRSGLDQFTLWVNRPLGTTDPPSFDAFKGDLDVGAINGVALYGTGAFSVDEIRIGTSYADVVPAAAPEPGSAVLLALVGSAGFVVRRVRRRRAVA